MPRMEGFHIIMCMLKTIFSGFIRTKMIFLKKSGLFSIDENVFQKIIHLQKKISEENLLNVCESLQILSKLTSGLSYYLELYLDMVTLPLNKTYAQRLQNWKGFLQCIREFLPHCFLLNPQNYAKAYHILLCSYDQFGKFTSRYV